VRRDGELPPPVASAACSAIGDGDGGEGDVESGEVGAAGNGQSTVFPLRRRKTEGVLADGDVDGAVADGMAASTRAADVRGESSRTSASVISEMSM